MTTTHGSENIATNCGTNINLHTPKLGQFDPKGISHIITQKLAWIENNPYMNLSEILSGTFSRREKIISNNGFYVKIKKLLGQFDPKNINWQKRWHLLRYPWFVKKLKLVQRNPLVEFWTIMFGDHKWRKKWNSLIFDWIRAINVIEKTSRKTSNYRIFVFFHKMHMKNDFRDFLKIQTICPYM